MKYSLYVIIFCAGLEFKMKNHEIFSFYITNKMLNFLA